MLREEIPDIPARPGGGTAASALLRVLYEETLSERQKLSAWHVRRMAAPGTCAGWPFVYLRPSPPVRNNTLGVKFLRQSSER